MKKLLTIMFSVILLLSSTMIAQVKITNTSIYYTMGQMLLANEINESGEPFAEFLGYNLDNLDPMIPNKPDSISYTLGIDNYEYSRYQLGTVISRSGIGLHMMWAPVIGQMASMEADDFDGKYTGGMVNGFKEDDELMKNIMHFSMLANQMAPSNPWPEFAEFVSGDPHLPQSIDAENFNHDFASLRWDRSLMDKTLNPGAMGQALMKQYLWAQDMLSAFHDSSDNGIDADGIITPDSAGSPNFDPTNNVFYGGDGLDGFIGQVLTAEAINKVKFIITKLAYNGSELGMVDPATYNPANGIMYFPKSIKVTESMVADGLPPKATSFEVTDANSELFDQLSLLWGTLNFKNMMDPNISDDAAHLAYHSVFDGNPFPAPMAQTGVAGPYDLMMGTSKVIFMNLMAMHFRSDDGTFVDASSLSNDKPQPGENISAINAGYITMVLSKMVEEFKGTPLESMALAAVNAQATFIVTNFLDKDNGFFNAYTVGQGADNNPKLAVSQAAIARGLYAAYSLTSNEDYLNNANKAYNYLIENFYVPEKMAFRTEAGNNEATYTPFNFAILSGALREASIVGKYSDAPKIYVRFFINVANAMQISEGGATGETGSDSDGDGIPFIPEQEDNLPPVFASEATLSLSTTNVNDYNYINNISIKTYPNPFQESINLQFELSNSANVKVGIYNIEGQLIKTLINKSLNSGVQNVKWYAENESSGTYYFKVSINNIPKISKVVVLNK